MDTAIDHIVPDAPLGDLAPVEPFPRAGSRAAGSLEPPCSPIPVRRPPDPLRSDVLRLRGARFTGGARGSRAARIEAA